MRLITNSKNTFIYKGLKKLNYDIKQGLRNSLYKSGLDIAGTSNKVNSGVIKQEMNKQKSGRAYKVYYGINRIKLKKGRIHIASRAGESPGVITGNLRNSVYFKVHGWYRLEIGATASYARALEYGTSKIKRRNFIIRPIANSRKKVLNNIDDTIKRYS